MTYGGSPTKCSALTDTLHKGLAKFMHVFDPILASGHRIAPGYNSVRYPMVSSSHCHNLEVIDNIWYGLKGILFESTAVMTSLFVRQSIKSCLLPHFKFPILYYSECSVTCHSRKKSSHLKFTVNRKGIFSVFSETK